MRGNSIADVTGSLSQMSPQNSNPQNVFALNSAKYLGYSGLQASNSTYNSLTKRNVDNVKIPNYSAMPLVVQNIDIRPFTGGLALIPNAGIYIRR